MSIAGINGYNYSNYYTGTKRNTAKANGMNSGLLSNVSSTSSNITLHMSGTEDSGNALTAVGFPDGSSASVYKADAYDSANPEYRVRYWDKEGNYTDTNVQINDVDPRNASYLEMLAYTTYSDVEGFTKNAFGDFMNAAGGVNGNPFSRYRAVSLHANLDNRLCSSYYIFGLFCAFCGQKRKTLTRV